MGHGTDGGERRYAALETALAYRFSRPELLETALTHSSCQTVPGAPAAFGRLEFLGDSACNLAVTEFIYGQYPDLDEGRLSKMRSVLISGRTLAGMARKLSLGTHLAIGKGQERTGGRENESILADAMEAVIGAVLLDGSFGTVRDIVRRELLGDIDRLLADETAQNHKSRLLELTQATDGSKPVYELERARGPAHGRGRVFTVAVRLNGAVIGRGTGLNRKEAEQDAARNALHEHFDEHMKEV